MNVHSGARAAAALAVSLGVHAAIFASLPGEGETMQIAGAAAYEAAALGSSFEDLAVAGGILQPVDGDSVEASAPPARERRVEPERIETAALAPPVRPLDTEATHSPAVERLRPPEAARETVAPAAGRQPAETPALALPLDRSQNDKLPALAPGEVAALPTLEESEEAQLPPPADTAEPGKAEPVRAEPDKAEPDKVGTPEAEPVAARTPDGTEAAEQAEPEKTAKTEAVAVPTRRPERIEPMEERPAETARVTDEVATAVEEEPAKPPVARKKEPKPARPKKATSQGPGQGKADRDTLRGSADGKPDAKSSVAGRGSTAGSPGNSAVSNYPGKVYAKIRRTRQHRAGGRGVVRVSFTISADGGLGSVAVAKGSGADAVDRAAIDHVRRSAPFPAPPPGAQRRFVIPIEVRG